MKNIIDTTVRKRFFAPLVKALSKSTFSRNCPGFTDLEHLESGVGRVIENTESGRAWVQQLASTFNVTVSVSTCFTALRSKRRHSVVEDVSDAVRKHMDLLCSGIDDPLAKHSELNGFAIYASDGHTHKASAHEKEICDKKRSVTHVYSLNLRTHSLAHLALTGPRGGKKKEHEITTLKRIGADRLRMGEANGVKVIHVYDPAIIDYEQWHKWKYSSGIYILTKEKSNSALDTIKALPWNQDDPRNIGVVSDELVANSKGRTLRRVTYIDHVTGNKFRFITNELTIPPGLIAFIYKLRWDVEKIFDVVKNKYHEIKAWANSEEAKNQQAMFITLAHNLMRIIEITIKQEENITDEVSAKKRVKKLESDKKKALANGYEISPLVAETQRITQHCVQFIRWIRSSLATTTSWGRSIEVLRPLMKKLL